MKKFITGFIIGSMLMFNLSAFCADATNPFLKALGLTDIQEAKLQTAVDNYNNLASFAQAEQITTVKQLMIMLLKGFYKEHVVKASANQKAQVELQSNQL